MELQLLEIDFLCPLCIGVIFAIPKRNSQKNIDMTGDGVIDPHNLLREETWRWKLCHLLWSLRDPGEPGR